MLQPFTWNGNTGQKLTPGQVKVLREMAAAKANRPTPTNLGEGLASVGDAVLYLSATDRANKAESEGVRKVTDALRAQQWGEVMADPWADPAQQGYAGSMLQRDWQLTDRDSAWAREDGAFDRGIDQRGGAADELGLEGDTRTRYVATGDFPSVAQPPSGYRETETGLEAIPGGPADVPKLNSTQQKELYDTDESVLAGQNVMSSLDQALSLNADGQTDAGWGAKGRSSVGANMGDERSARTLDLDNIVTGQALEALKATFGAAPTEGERKILIEIQGSVDQPRDVRQRIFERAKILAQRRVAFNQAKAEAIRAGSYNDPGFVPPVFRDEGFEQATQAEDNVVAIKSEDDYAALPPGTVYIAPDGQKRTKR